MKKDIEIPVVKNVSVAIIREWNEEFLSNDWNAYIINDKEVEIVMVLVATKGEDGNRKTSTMRLAINRVAPKSFEKIEMIQEDVLGLNNEFSVTFFAENELYEKKYVFKKDSVTEANCGLVPTINRNGVQVK